jgi:2-C-methyl-D-erythritol 4-phosphate cytidylyltransferase
MEKIAVIVAAGSGNRMGSGIPKQFLRVGKLPVLMHTLKVFYQFDATMELRLVLAEDLIAQWKLLCSEYSFSIPHSVLPGGETRFHSVRNGIEQLSDKALVAIHDGVRPLVSQATLQRTFDTAAEFGTAVPVMPLTESIREQVGEDTVARDRNLFFTVQTPQVFQAAILKDAYSVPYEESFTDDASVVEKAVYKILTCEGNAENIKITSPVDMLIAEALLIHAEKKQQG